MTESSPPLTPPLSKIRGLYLILDQGWASRWVFAEILQQAADLGVTVVQYRNKTDAMNEVYRQALELRKIASDSGVAFIVNDRCDVSLAVGADGVHLGQSDLPIGLAREVLGADCLIGLSTHSPEQVVEATKLGADYIGYGPIFPTATKPDHEPVVGLEGLKNIRPLTPLPIVAIGGIQSESVSKVVGAGANAAAVASGILNAPDPQEALRRYTAPFR